MAEWDEIKRLAADFQRTQESDTLQKISERNCIDIVKKLSDLHFIELIYTCDGKEFLTPDHLRKEIEDEIYYNGGRMQIHDLATKLNVDYQHVDTKAKELAENRPEDYNIILGQVIHSMYKNTLMKHISDCMLIDGQLSIADFAKTLDLASEFLLNIVKELLPRLTDDFVSSSDERTFYSGTIINKYKSIIAGTLTAITRPISTNPLIKKLDIPEKLFVMILEGLIKEGRLDAVYENKVYSPSIHSREQNEYINKFYQSNSYIEYDVLSRMSIKNPKAFLKKKFPTGIQLKTCFVSPDMVSQVESLIDDCITSNGWIDMSTLIPPSIGPEDLEQMIQDILKKSKQLNLSCLQLEQTFIISNGFITICRSTMKEFFDSKAHEFLNEGKLLEFFYDGKMPGSNSTPDQKKTGPKPASPEPEITDRKRSRAARRAAISPDRTSSKTKKEPLVFMEPGEIVGKLKVRITDSDECPGEILEHIAKSISRELNELFMPIAKNMIDEHLKTIKPPEDEKNQLESVETENPTPSQQ